MADFIRIMTKINARLLYTLIVQFAIIYFFIFTDDSTPFGYLLLILPLTVIFSTIINYAVLKLIINRQALRPSWFHKILLTIGILIIVAVISLLLTVIARDLPFTIGFTYFYLGFPALVIEVIYRMIMIYLSTDSNK